MRHGLPGSAIDWAAAGHHGCAFVGTEKFYTRRASEYAGSGGKFAADQDAEILI